MTRWKDPLAWLWGLGAAAIGGGATAISTIIVAPETFNLKGGLSKVGAVALVSALVNAAMYLKQSPLPPIEEVDTAFVKKPDAQ